MAAAKAELERLAGDVTSLRNELKEKDAQLSVAAELEWKAKAQLAEAEDSAAHAGGAAERHGDAGAARGRRQEGRREQ